ncbi:MAG: 50S ribosomal protein L13 [Candidatus Nanoarchaeia archaeon]
MNEKKIVLIDGKNAVFGRLCSFAAKKALEGNEIVIINSDKVVVTGKKSSILEEYKKRRSAGSNALRGPFHSRLIIKMLKRGIRGMLPNYRWGTGKETFSRIKCYEGIPKEYEGKKAITTYKPNHEKYITLKEISQKV